MSHKKITGASWISEDTWRLAGQRTELGQTHTANQIIRRMATRQFQAALREYSRCKVGKLGGGESLVVND